ncbi:MAG: hypothetical protein DSO00_07390 [Archaeoglobi archaeon]|nr:MAG: hypothetical protein DSO00_07390 [Archaeoglobi archaeon]
MLYAPPLICRFKSQAHSSQSQSSGFSWHPFLSYSGAEKVKEETYKQYTVLAILAIAVAAAAAFLARRRK